MTRPVNVVGDGGTPKQTRAMVLESPGSFAERMLPVPLIASGDALLAVDACGVCGSDVARVAGRTTWDAYPAVIGHEIVGTVICVGDHARSLRKLQEGDRVVVEEAIPCRQCRLCLDGDHRLCERRSRFGDVSLLGEPGLWGGFAEHVIVPARAVVHRVPPSLAVELAVRFIPIANALSWANEVQVGPDDNVLILGPGQNGLALAAVSRLRGARSILVAGLSHDRGRLQLALRAGADLVREVDVDPWTISSDRVDAPSVVFDLVPDDASTITTAVGLLRARGRLLLAGAKRSNPVPNLLSDVIFQKELRILGVTARRSWAIPAALDLLVRTPETFAALEGPGFALASVALAIATVGSKDPARPAHAFVVPHQLEGEKESWSNQT